MHSLQAEKGPGPVVPRMAVIDPSKGQATDDGIGLAPEPATEVNASFDQQGGPDSLETYPLQRTGDEEIPTNEREQNEVSTADVGNESAEHPVDSIDEVYHLTPFVTRINCLNACICIE